MLNCRPSRHEISSTSYSVESPLLGPQSQEILGSLGFGTSDHFKAIRHLLICLAINLHHRILGARLLGLSSINWQRLLGIPSLFGRHAAFLDGATPFGCFPKSH